jgi:hypothetical protein
MGFIGEDWGKTICFGGRLHNKTSISFRFLGEDCPTTVLLYNIKRREETERPYFGTGDLEAFIEAYFLEF